MIFCLKSHFDSSKHISSNRGQTSELLPYLNIMDFSRINCVHTGIWVAHSGAGASVQVSSFTAQGLVST